MITTTANFYLIIEFLSNALVTLLKSLSKENKDIYYVSLNFDFQEMSPNSFLVFGHDCNQ